MKTLKTLLVAVIIVPCMIMLTACCGFNLPSVNWKFWEKEKSNHGNGGDTDVVVESVSFAVDSWNTIKFVSAEIAKGANPADFDYHIGDEKDIVCLTGEIITVQIWGFNHDNLSDGSGKAGITIGMKNLLANESKINDSATNLIGWKDSLIRNYLSNNVFSSLPVDLQAAIKPVIKQTAVGNYADENNPSDEIILSNDKLFLFSSNELNSFAVSVNKAEGSPYEYWEVNFSSNAKRKSLGGDGVYKDWWCRTPFGWNVSAFSIVASSGNFNSSPADTGHGICFGFAV